MTSLTLEHLHQDLLLLKQDVAEIKSYMDEEFELSTWAKKRIAEVVDLDPTKFDTKKHRTLAKKSILLERAFSERMKTLKEMITTLHGTITGNFSDYSNFQKALLEGRSLLKDIESYQYRVKIHSGNL